MALNQKNVKLPRPLSVRVESKTKKEEIILIDKPLGFTPLQALDLLRYQKPSYQNEKLSYAGRLDPMAEGLMLVLVGSANKERAKYLSLSKEYECEILFGLSTDTGDVLGLLKKQNKNEFDFKCLKIEVKDSLFGLAGKKIQSAPVYSSPRLAGKRDFKKEIEIFSIKLLKSEIVSVSNLKKNILTKLKILAEFQKDKDFRQARVIAGWEKFFKQTGRQNFLMVKIRVFCSSGTYIRVLAEDVGQAIGEPTCVLSLNRTKVGDYKIQQALKLR